MSFVLSRIDPWMSALMVVLPASTAVARPLLLIVATDVMDELQVTCVVMSRLVPSEYMPVAVNCLVLLIGMIGVVGVTEIEDRVAEATVRVVLPEILPAVAVMFEVPVARAVTRPLLLTVATGVLDELQVTCVVMS